MPIEETLGRKGGREPGKKALCILGVPESRPGLVPLGYKFEYSISLKIFFLLISRKVCCKALSRFKVGSSFNFLISFDH